MADGWQNSVFYPNSATGWSMEDVLVKFADVASTNGAIPADVAIAGFGYRALVEIGIREAIQAAKGCTPRHAQRLMNAMDLPQYRGMRHTSHELLNGTLRELPTRSETSPVNGAAAVKPRSLPRGRPTKAPK
jgi:hypothetical protein